MPLSAKDLKEVCSGLAMTLVGLLAAVIGRTYELGTISDMGPGFLPTWLGIILACIGVLIMLTSWRSDRSGARSEWQLPDTRGSICIIAGLLAFLICAKYIGFVAASLSLIFIAAMGDKKQTWIGAALLAGTLTGFGVVVFCYGLHLPFPLFSGSS